jgi:glycosyltransferase involved in cell wall biosynthesis
MTDPVFTVLLPVHRPPAMLPFAIESVLAQERQDFELFVICDGAPRATADVARGYAARDPRIRVFEHPKGERYGEAYRHQALQHARGAYVCQLGDDDLWLPNHLGEMGNLLEEVDFGNLPHVEVTPDGRLVLFPGDLADPATRLMMQSRPFNFFGPTASGYRLQAYRTLTVGWSPAPTELATDLFMWRSSWRVTICVSERGLL